MFALIYASQAHTKFDHATLEQLCKQSEQRNQELDITGYLYFENNRFFQYIEGPKENIEILMRSLQNDARHSITGVLKDEKIRLRRFPEWRMKFISKNSIHLDHMIDNYFDFMKTSADNYRFYAQKIWKGVENLSYLHNKQCD